MQSLFFVGAPEIVVVGGRNSTGSPISAAALPAESFQRVRYNADKSSMLSEVACLETAVDAARTVALGSVGITAEKTTAEAMALIESGEYR